MYVRVPECVDVCQVHEGAHSTERSVLESLKLEL